MRKRRMEAAWRGARRANRVLIEVSLQLIGTQGTGEAAARSTWRAARIDQLSPLGPAGDVGSPRGDLEADREGAAGSGKRTIMWQPPYKHSFPRPLVPPP